MQHGVETATNPGGLARGRRLLQDLGPAAPLLAVAVLGPIGGALVVAATSTAWLTWFGNDVSSVAVFWLAGSLLTAACLLPTHATSLVAGYVFGSWLGSLLAWLIVLAASMVGFSLWHRVIGSRAMRAIEKSPKARLVHRALLGRGLGRTIWLIALLRLSPVLPFAATNLLLAALGVRAAAFLTATVIGITPRAVGVALIGAELPDLDWQAGGSTWSTVLAIGSTLIVMVLVGRIARAALRRENAEVDTPSAM